MEKHHSAWRAGSAMIPKERETLFNDVGLQA